MCAPIGGACTMQVCARDDEPKEDPEEEPVKCGKNTCDKGEVCCNENCGICAKPDGPCPLIECLPEEPEPEPEPEGEKCGDNTCPAGEVCCNESCEFPL